MSSVKAVRARGLEVGRGQVPAARLVGSSSNRDSHQPDTIECFGLALTVPWLRSSRSASFNGSVRETCTASILHLCQVRQ